MKEYKRVTKRLDNYIKIEIESPYADIIAIERLAELEDEIENGTLVELPCKVGDTVYHLSDKKISEEKVKQVKCYIDNGKIDLFNSSIMADDNYSEDYNFYRFSNV